MTATDELRHMLDERGVEWDELVGHPVVVGTEWHDRDGYPCAALEHADDVPDGMLSVHANLTPEQAIAATLGRGTCRIETTENWLPAERYHRCKECGAFFAALDASHDIPPRFCPNCGRRIVGPTTNDVDTEEDDG